MGKLSQQQLTGQVAGWHAELAVAVRCRWRGGSWQAAGVDIAQGGWG